jgi:hypothetical protein
MVFIRWEAVTASITFKNHVQITSAHLGRHEQRG